MNADCSRSEAARRAILARLREAPYAGGAATGDAARESAPGMAPGGTNPYEHFVARVRAGGASLEEVGTGAEVFAAMTRWLAEHGVPGELVTGEDPAIRDLERFRRPDHPRLARRPFAETDRVTLTHACAGVAETGTLALRSGPDNPVTLNFLPEINIILLRRGDILRNLDELWPRFRAARDDAGWPRCINLVTGPSRTADIEQTIQLGAHGPRHLHVILYRTAEN